MIDISKKKITKRIARATGKIFLPEDVLGKIKEGKIPKGDAIKTAEVSSLLAIKNAPFVIPHCHTVKITKAGLKVRYGENFVQLESNVEGFDRTGFEIEALYSVMVGLLTIYDMCKAFIHRAEIGEIKLIQKSGGKNNFKISR
ncbi:MAG: cyclic pyranopterin monophosphate synthase MoaC [Candidatus Omnitrophica bacterium]|nr:cyclic pyranopterin monophosphate synthase MoaC [Candidatus Omnitrophota bacterium]